VALRCWNQESQSGSTIKALIRLEQFKCIQILAQMMSGRGMLFLFLMNFISLTKKKKKKKKTKTKGR